MRVRSKQYPRFSKRDEELLGWSLSFRKSIRNALWPVYRTNPMSLDSELVDVIRDMAKAFRKVAEAEDRPCARCKGTKKEPRYDMTCMHCWGDGMAPMDTVNALLKAKPAKPTARGGKDG